MDFDHVGEWEEKDQNGHAIHAPNIIRNIVVTRYRVEWLNLSEPLINFYAKNHMVATLLFECQAQLGTAFHGTRQREAAIVGQEDSRCDCWSGLTDNRSDCTDLSLTWFLSTRRGSPVITISQASTRSVCSSIVCQLIAPFTTLPTLSAEELLLVTSILRLKMHHFLFLPYTVGGSWKGCEGHTYVLSICCGDDIDMIWQSPLLGRVRPPGRQHRPTD